MKTQSTDTDPKSEQVMISLLRQKDAAEKFTLIRSLSQSTIQLSKRAIKRANQGIEDDQVNVIFIELHYGKKLARQFQQFISK